MSPQFFLSTSTSDLQGVSKFVSKVIPPIFPMHGLVRMTKALDFARKYFWKFKKWIMFRAKVLLHSGQKVEKPHRSLKCWITMHFSDQVCHVKNSFQTVENPWTTSTYCRPGWDCTWTSAWTKLIFIIINFFSDKTKPMPFDHWAHKRTSRSIQCLWMIRGYHFDHELQDTL